MDEKILDKILDISERFFNATDDPEQIPVTKEALDKLQKLHPKAFIYRAEKGEPVSWIVVVPTTEELMNKFLKSEINERELFNLTEPQSKYGAIYFCAAFTVPKYRRKGYAIEMFKEAINSISHTEDFKLVAWPVTPEGRKMINKLSSVLSREILIKN